LLGRKAAIFPLIPCHQCDACQIGEYAQCKNYNYFGSRCDGGFAEYVAVPVWNLVLAPDTLTYQEIAMTEPAAVAIHALRQGGIEIGDNVVIFGAGPIGIMLGQWARAWGADKVILVDIDTNKIDFAKSLGFDLVFNNKNMDVIKCIYDETNCKGADLAIECAGVSMTLEQCFLVLRPFGRAVAMGNPVGEMKLNQKAYWELLRKQLTLRGTWNSSYVSIPKNDWELSIRAMESGKLNVKQLVTHQVKLDDCMKPFLMMEKGLEFFNKVMFVIDDE
jgi:L-iditol 2-dehydrogenase